VIIRSLCVNRLLGLFTSVFEAMPGLQVEESTATQRGLKKTTAEKEQGSAACCGSGTRGAKERIALTQFAVLSVLVTCKKQAASK
jgi:hypothetical protein